METGNHIDATAPDPNATALNALDTTLTSYTPVGKTCIANITTPAARVNLIHNGRVGWLVDVYQTMIEYRLNTNTPNDDTCLPPLAPLNIRPVSIYLHHTPKSLTNSNLYELDYEVGPQAKRRAI